MDLIRQDWDPRTHIGHRLNQENVEAIIESILDSSKDSYYWEGQEEGIRIAINGVPGFVKNDDDLAAEVYKLWSESQENKKN